MENHNLRWTVYPGCYEYHLRCRYQNLLFPVHRRDVTETELLEAQERDENEKQEFQQEVQALSSEMMAELANRSDTKIDDLLTFLKRISELLERSGQIGGELSEERKILARLIIALDQDLARFSDREGNEATGLYRELREHVYRGVKIHVNKFLAQMTREQSPILPEDVVPRLLSEDVETIRDALPFLDKNIDALRLSITEQLGNMNNKFDVVLERDPSFFTKVETILSRAYP